MTPDTLFNMALTRLAGVSLLTDTILFLRLWPIWGALILITVVFAYVESHEAKKEREEAYKEL